jgi:hypothetical protein
VVHGDTIVAEMPASEATEHNILGAALSHAQHDTVRGAA